MFRLSRFAAAGAAFAVAGVSGGDSANAQWGYAPSANYLHAPGAGAYGYGAAWQSSLYAPSYDYTAQYGYSVPAYGSSCYAPAYGYGYDYSGLRWQRGRTRHGIYTPYAGPEEIEYKFRRDGTVRVDVDD